MIEVLNTGSVKMEFPISNIGSIFESPGMMPISVHGFTLTVNTEKLKDYLQIHHLDEQTLESLAKEVELRMTPEEVMDLRAKQTLALNRGLTIKVDSEDIVPDYSSFSIILPDVTTKIKIESIPNDENLDDYITLTPIKEEFRTQTKGLDKVLKTSIIAEILNTVQGESYQTECKFYHKIIERLSQESNTGQMFLLMYRYMMQYALNVDTLELKTILTEVLLNE